MSLAHAEHNKDLCLFLNENGNFPDWVITSAFYSAIHYIYQLFPLDIDLGGNTVKFNNFNRYYTHIKRTKQISKHDATVSLTEEYYPEFACELKDNCFTARYINYNFEDIIVNQSVSCLKLIKEQCTELVMKK